MRRACVLMRHRKGCGRARIVAGIETMHSVARTGSSRHRQAVEFLRCPCRLDRDTARGSRKRWAHSPERVEMRGTQRAAAATRNPGALQLPASPYLGLQAQTRFLSDVEVFDGVAGSAQPSRKRRSQRPHARGLNGPIQRTRMRRHGRGDEQDRGVGPARMTMIRETSCRKRRRRTWPTGIRACRSTHSMTPRFASVGRSRQNSAAPQPVRSPFTPPGPICLLSRIGRKPAPSHRP